MPNTIINKFPEQIKIRASSAYNKVNSSYSSGYDPARAAIQITDSLGGSFKHDFLCKEGEYLLYFTHTKGPDMGILKVYIDDTYVSSINCYSSSSTLNVLSLLDTNANIGEGRHTLTVLCDTQDARSSGKKLTLMEITLFRNGGVTSPIAKKFVDISMLNTCLDIHALSVTKSNFVVYNTNQQIYSYRAYFLPAKINSYCEFYVTFPDSVYQASMITRTITAYGIVTLYIDGVNCGTVDCYSSSTTLNVLKTFSNKLRLSGRLLVRLEVTGKNASATDYGHTFTFLHFEKVTDSPDITIKNKNIIGESDSFSQVIHLANPCKNSISSTESFSRTNAGSVRAFNFVGNQSMNADDYIETEVYLGEGNYIAYVTYLTSVDLTSWKLYIDDIDCGSMTSGSYSGEDETAYYSRALSLTGGSHIVRMVAQSSGMEKLGTLFFRKV